MRIILVLCFILSITAADVLEQPATSVLPVEAQRVLNNMDALIVELQRDAIKELKKVQDDQTKKGKLDEALAIREAIKKMEKQSVAPGKQPLAPVKQPLVGEWTDNMNNEQLTLLADKTFVGKFNNPSWNVGTWEINQAGDTLTLLLASNGSHQRYKIRDDTHFVSSFVDQVWTKKP